MTAIFRQLRPPVMILLMFTLLTGFAYPAAIAAVAQVAFPTQAHGSLIAVKGQAIGSSLIGQSFQQPKYFIGRLSAAGADGYDANASAGSNLGPTNQALIDRITQSVDTMRAANGNAPIPVDLVTTSASGLDADISPAGAGYQVARVARARGISEDDVRAAVARHTEGPLLGFLGQARVHVLELNRDLDGLLR